MRVRTLRSLPFFALLLIVCAPVSAQEEEQSAKKPEFLRYVDDGHGGGKLETAVATYKNAAGVTVHLVAAVHIADQSYYDTLNKSFKGYDSVLYEMVKAKNAAPPQPGVERTSNSMISMVQRFMKDALDLQFQLDAVDYSRANFVHADLDYETFEKMEAERGESIWTLMLQQMLKQMANPPDNQPEIGLGELMTALASPDHARALKLLLARQFGNIEDQMSSFGGTVLITERNKACFKVLDKQIADGKADLGIFYGAGHMPDMEKRLESRGFHKTGTEWLVAWNMSDKSDDADADPKPAPRARPKHKATNDDDADANGVIKVEYIHGGR